jgi:hypothetical protein
MSGGSRVQSSPGPSLSPSPSPSPSPSLSPSLSSPPHFYVVIPYPFKNDINSIILFHRAMTHRILAFDIGIKNLAYAVLQQEEKEPPTVLSLENVNLLAGDTPPPVPCVTQGCRSRPSVLVMGNTYCRRHCPKTHRILPELMKKKAPPARRLRELVQEHFPLLPPSSKSPTIEDSLRCLSTGFALPYRAPTGPKVASLSLTTIHDALRRFVYEKWPEFQGTTHILLENQPAFTNPHMKSVQVLLFATLRECFLQHGEQPDVRLVHAKKKVSDAPKGDAGYVERKRKSEERVHELFQSGRLVGPIHYDAWKQAKKRSDMADALCMAVDVSF